MTPQKLEAQFLKIERSLILRLSQISWSVNSGLVLGTLCLFLVFPLWSTPQPEWSRFYLAQDRFWGAVALFYGFYFSLLVPHRWKSWCYLFLMCTAWLVPLFILQIARPVIIAPIIFVIASTFWVSIYRRRAIQANAKVNKFLFSLIVIGGFVLVLWLLGQDAAKTQDHRLFRYFWTLHLELLVLFFLGNLFSTKTTPLENSLNPLQLLAPFPWPESIRLAQEPRQLYELRVAGLLQLIRTNFTFALLMLVLKWLPKSAGPWTSFTHYVSYLLFISAALGTVSGFIKLFGYQAPDLTYFLFLAKSPLEIWQRGSTYMAKFLFQFVYLPSWKFTRRTWVAALAVLLAVFVHLHLFHDLFLREVVRWLTPELPVAATSWAVTFGTPLVWSLIWVIWIGIFQVLRRIIPFLHSDSGAWVAILLTHLGSSQIMLATREVATILDIGGQPF
jgi:hypothetical protein